VGVGRGRKGTSRRSSKASRGVPQEFSGQWIALERVLGDGRVGVGWGRIAFPQRKGAYADLFPWRKEIKRSEVLCRKGLRKETVYTSKREFNPWLFGSLRRSKRKLWGERGSDSSGKHKISVQ